MTPYMEVVRTAADAEMADTIAKELVRQRPAACGPTSGPITSCYGWEGELETSIE